MALEPPVPGSTRDSGNAPGTIYSSTLPLNKRGVILAFGGKKYSEKHCNNELLSCDIRPVNKIKTIALLKPEVGSLISCCILHIG